MTQVKLPKHFTEDFLEIGQHACFTGKTGRTLLLLKLPDSTLRCMDAHCFHMGGSLAGGDIEDLGNGTFGLRCPHHARCINLETGQELRNFAGSDGCPPGTQRMHPVTIGADKHLSIMVAPADGTVASDIYNGSLDLQHGPKQQVNPDLSSPLRVPVTPEKRRTTPLPTCYHGPHARKRRAVAAVRSRQLFTND